MGSWSDGRMDGALICSMANGKSISEYFRAFSMDWFPLLRLPEETGSLYSGSVCLIAGDRIRLVFRALCRVLFRDASLQLLTNEVLHQAFLAIYCHDVLRLLRNSGILETNSIHPSTPLQNPHPPKFWAIES